MKTNFGYLTFCTNLFPSESWESHFNALKSEIPIVKKQLAPNQKMGIGLRLSNKASLELIKPDKLEEFKEWLRSQDCFVFTMNGFPYGNFHKTRVKDAVHTPDWTNPERLEYTSRLFHILTALLPNGMQGSISTSPLSYKYWFKEEERNNILSDCTKNIVKLVLQLYKIHKETGTLSHVDIEPEADGLIENSNEFIRWYTRGLLPEGIRALQQAYQISETEAREAIKRHVQLCYDVCHFAVGYEAASEVIKKLKAHGIRIGKWQLSAALKIKLNEDPLEKEQKLNELKKFDEPVYLHQVVAREKKGSLLRYRDLPEAFNTPTALKAEEWRSHFHVPIFVKDYGLLRSTQSEVGKVLQIQKDQKLSDYLEVETYTWDVLPEGLKLPLAESVVRELEWVMERL